MGFFYIPDTRFAVVFLVSLFYGFFFYLFYKQASCPVVDAANAAAAAEGGRKRWNRNKKSKKNGGEFLSPLARSHLGRSFCVKNKLLLAVMIHYAR